VTLHTTDEWICLDDGEDDYVIERVEFRVKGKKRWYPIIPVFLNSFITFSNIYTSTGHKQKPCCKRKEDVVSPIDTQLKNNG
jgi:hypothetical protein